MPGAIAMILEKVGLVLVVFVCSGLSGWLFVPFDPLGHFHGLPESWLGLISGLFLLLFFPLIFYFLLAWPAARYIMVPYGQDEEWRIGKLHLALF